MYERFTDRSRKVMQLANREAQKLDHEYLGSEHILLGLCVEGSGVGANVLKNLGIDAGAIRKHIVRGVPIVTMGKLPMTPRAKKVIELSMESAQALHHHYVGTEHLLIGLANEEQSAGATMLASLGATPEAVMAEVLRVLELTEADLRLTVCDIEQRIRIGGIHEATGEQWLAFKRKAEEFESLLAIMKRALAENG